MIRLRSMHHVTKKSNKLERSKRDFSIFPYSRLYEQGLVNPKGMLRNNAMMGPSSKD